MHTLAYNYANKKRMISREDIEKFGIGYTEIGAYKNSWTASEAGLVKVYEFSGGSQAQLGVNIFGENENDRFGSSVSINATGTRIAVGVKNYDGAEESIGKVNIYDYSGSDWTLSNSFEGESYYNLIALKVAPDTGFEPVTK